MSKVATFALQSQLPRLPVPPLEETCARYLHSLRPLLTENEFNTSEKNVKNFLASPLSRQLQQRLIDLDRSSESNWLDDQFWLQKAYHEWREPLLVNSNWYMLGVDDPHHPKDLLANGAKRSSGDYTYFQARRAAHMIYEGIDFKQILPCTSDADLSALPYSQTLPVEMLKGGKPLCMHQYTRVLGVTRIPLPHCDTFSQVNENANHVIIIVRDQIYPLDVFHVVAGERKRVSLEELERNILAIIQDVMSEPLQAPITILTAAHRDLWAISRNHLLSISPVNRQSLTTIEDALFAFSLDDLGAGSNTSDWSRNVFTGQGVAHNRWFDKSLNFVVEANGKCALLGEHSPCDALTASYFFDHMLKKPCPAGASTSSITSSKSDISVQRLVFEIDKTMDKYLEEAKVDTAKTIAFSETTVLIWDQYGTDWVKKVGKVSPDAYFQMCLQLAYYKTHKKVTPTYETASTRQFLHGRTETIRTCSVDSKRFVESWDNKTVDVSNFRRLFVRQSAIKRLATGINLCNVMQNKTRYQLLQTACKSHSAYTAVASNGQGCDRHLMALRILNASHPNSEIHPIFTDPAYSESQTWRLSTSGLHAGIRLMGTGFGAITQDGYGINYMAAPTLVKFGMECKRVKETATIHEFADTLVQTLRELRQVCEDVNGLAKPTSKI
ncbi:hypothetical protein INT43_006969 [Umbelopsis isabellina]|uniref:Choline/carnitine acyltransferase domain-containing protein n=1 Tax=Mortierella isabellina TaxID=91625 RepID=A0A8H7PXF0_MORIS|nr:hypothetical protein INT43_006969 [Umbelopsis isabellina]